MLPRKIFQRESYAQILQPIQHLLEQILEKEEHMSAQLDALTAQVAANTAAEQSAITLLGVLAAKVAAGDDPAKLQALTDSLKASGDALTAAVTANTPAA